MVSGSGAVPEGKNELCIRFGVVLNAVCHQG